MLRCVCERDKGCLSGTVMSNSKFRGFKEIADYGVGAVWFKSQENYSDQIN